MAGLVRANYFNEPTFEQRFAHVKSAIKNAEG
jgi:hypothetical protein